MKLGSQMTLGDVPFYYYTDPDGDQIALPSTERMVSEPTAVRIMSQNFMPVLPIRGRSEVRLGSFDSLGGALLAGPWAPLDIQPDETSRPLWLLRRHLRMKGRQRRSRKSKPARPPRQSRNSTHLLADDFPIPLKPTPNWTPYWLASSRTPAKPQL